MTPKQELLYQLGHLNAHKVIYREVLVSVVKIEEVLLNERFFSVKVKPIHFLLSQKRPRKRMINASKQLADGWKFGCVWDTLRYENNWFYGYGTFGFCANPELVLKVEDLVKQNLIDEARDLIYSW